MVRFSLQAIFSSDSAFYMHKHMISKLLKFPRPPCKALDFRVGALDSVMAGEFRKMRKERRADRAGHGSVAFTVFAELFSADGVNRVEIFVRLPFHQLTTMRPSLPGA
jgi:hypothetical protein